MIFPGHVAAGYLVAKAILAAHRELSVNEANKLLLLGAFSGFAPDLDLIYHFIKSKSFRFHSEDTHRHYITHTPFFWIFVGIIIFLFTDNLLISLVVSLSALSHIFLDSFGSGHGLMYFWPFFKSKFSFVKYTDKNPASDTLIKYYLLIFKEYAKHVTFWMEIAVTIIALWVMYN
jgi:hypothetical protein